MLHKIYPRNKSGHAAVMLLRLIISESRQVGKFCCAVMHVHGAQLCAALQSWHGLAGIEQAMLIPCFFNRMKYTQFFGAELATHLIYFFHAYAMFTGDGAADCHA